MSGCECFCSTPLRRCPWGAKFEAWKKGRVVFVCGTHANMLVREWGERVEIKRIGFVPTADELGL